MSFSIGRKDIEKTYIPLANTHSQTTPFYNRLPLSTSISLGFLTGILIYLTLSPFYIRPVYVLQSPLNAAGGVVPHTPSIAVPPVIHNADYLSLEELRDTVAQTKGYWARDWSLHLGWDNVRYTINGALLQGAILNRTVVLPSYIYARSCEFSISVCANYARMVNHGDAVGSNQWRHLPMDEQMSWRVPTSVMLNMTLLRSTQPVITVSEYLRLHDLPENVEVTSGAWGRREYHQSPYVFDTTSGPPSLQVVEHEWYHAGINWVDMIPDDMKRRGRWNDEGGDPMKGERGSWGPILKTPVNEALQAALPDQPKVLDWDRVRQILQENGYLEEVHEDGLMEKLLNENEWEVLYTYRTVLGMESVLYPIRQVAPRETLRSLREGYGHLTADVVLFASTKPGSVHFTTVANRDLFSRIVLYHVRATDKVYELAAILAERMREKTGGRMWLAARMGRADSESTLEAYLSRVQDRLARGRDVLRSLRTHELKSYDIPSATPDFSVTQAMPPQDTDPYFISIDARDAGNITYLIDSGAVLMSDLLTVDDRRAFGWPLMLSDVVGLVEQALLAKAYYFYAHAQDAFAGGVVGMRAVAGLDPRTTFSG